MQSTQTLLDEHECILDMLACLAKLGEDAARGEPVDPQSAVELLQLFESFADGLHQRREEEVLFPALLGRVTPAEEDALRALVDDHHYEWCQMVELERSLRATITGDAAAAREFSGLAKSYVEMQRAHVAHENKVLPQLAGRLLAPEDDRLIVQAYRELEAADSSAAGVRDHVYALCGKLGVGARV